MPEVVIEGVDFADTFAEIVDQLAAARTKSEQRRLKEALARLTFGKAIVGRVV